VFQRNSFGEEPFIRPFRFEKISHFKKLLTENWKLQTDLGVTQAAQGAGFSGLRFAPVPMKNRY